MRPKKYISFLLGLVVIFTLLVVVGSTPAISHAVTPPTPIQDQIAALNSQLIQRLLALIDQLQAQLQQLIAAKNTTTVQCGWCGNSCINWAGKNRSNTVCADVMPPTNSYCQNINGTCQITNNTTKYSCSTAMGTISDNNYTCCIPDPNGTFNSLAECQNSCPITTTCITEGNSISVTPIGFTQECCSGLVLCPPPSGILGSRGTCKKTCTIPCITEGNKIFSSKYIINPSCCTGLTLCQITNGLSIEGEGICQKSCNSSSCYDSDGGKNYNTKGNLTGLSCASSGACTSPILEDTCVSDSILKEYYCDGINKSSLDYTCPNGCQDGACKSAVPTPSIDLKINGSDGPITVLPGSIITATWTSTGQLNCSTYGTHVPLVRPGIWGVSTDFTNFASSGTEQMYAKDGNDPNKTILDIGVECGEGLYDHVIVNLANIICTGSDDGNSIYQKGTIVVEKASIKPWESSGTWSYTDSCGLSESLGLILTEYVCSPNSLPDVNGSSAFTRKVIVCSSGYTCCDGACKEIQPNLKSPCSNYGDINGDGYLTKADLDLMLKMGYPPKYSLSVADVNKDGVIDYYDTELINKYLVNAINTFPVCTTNNGNGVVEGVETHIFSENLGYGMENDDIRILQSLLAQKSYFSGIVTGYFGWQTEEAVKAFQTANNISATGLVGELTRELLNK